MVSPNPLVGAVVLDASGKKIAEGYHPVSGGPHAEVVALEKAGKKAKGGTLYVNLEPCNHQGKTGPCTEAIIQAGVEQVYCGTLDPNPEVAGRGRDKLQNSRISVRYGYLEDECAALNETFFHNITTGSPFVSLKLAMTLDGKIAARGGQSKWITSEISRQAVHYHRSRHDAILTSAQTVAHDNPELTVREIDVPDGFADRKMPTRVILDRTFRLNPEQYQIFNTQIVPTWVFTSAVRHNQQHSARARAMGIEVFEVDDTGIGLDLQAVVDQLGEMGVTSIWIETGGRLATQFLKQELVNKLFLFYAPKILSDTGARAGFSGVAPFSLDEATPLRIQTTQQLEKDLLVVAYPA